MKKGVVEAINVYYPEAPGVLSATIPIFLGVMAYWLFRTPSEVIKTQVSYFLRSIKYIVIKAKVIL